MKNILLLSTPLLLAIALFLQSAQPKSQTIYLIGDSTVADYSLEDQYAEKRYPLVGWGQEFGVFLQKDSLKALPHKLQINSSTVRLDNRAKGGRSTRTFFEEGRWRSVYTALQKNDLVLIQFGHNDAAVDKTERYVTVAGYQEFLRLYIHQTREKGAIPILLTPVARNYPWKDGALSNVHGEYPQAMKAIADELAVDIIDLSQLSMDFFSTKGQDYVSKEYFMNLGPQLYPAYPDGQKDNTHFQVAGGKAVAQLVYNALKKL